MTEKDLKSIKNIVKEEVSPLKKDFKEVKRTVDANNRSLIKLENTIEVYSDGLDLERKRSDKHEERLETVEDKLNLNP